MNGKIKDNLNACIDLQVLRIRKELHSVQKNDYDQWEILKAYFNISNEEKTLKAFVILRTLMVMHQS